ncbi:MAG: hypothetical protein AAGA70_09540, partial [Pseudomonadota bacterium]
IYQARFSETLNQTREGLMKAEENLPETARDTALEHADAIAGLIEKGNTMPFYQAYDQMAVRLSGRLEITQNAAKGLMNETYAQANGRELYDDGKAAEEAYHKPVREAEIAARKAEQLQNRSRSRSYS